MRGYNWGEIAAVGDLEGPGEGELDESDIVAVVVAEVI